MKSELKTEGASQQVAPKARLKAGNPGIGGQQSSYLRYGGFTDVELEPSPVNKTQHS